MEETVSLCAIIAEFKISVQQQDICCKGLVWTYIDNKFPSVITLRCPSIKNLLQLCLTFFNYNYIQHTIPMHYKSNLVCHWTTKQRQV